MYQLQLTTSQVGLQDILEHTGATSSLSASSPAPRLQSQAPLRPCPRQGRETPGQTAETLPAADCLMLTTERIQAKGGGAHQELPHYHIHFSGFHVYSESSAEHLSIKILCVPLRQNVCHNKSTPHHQIPKLEKKKKTRSRKTY